MVFKRKAPRAARRGAAKRARRLPRRVPRAPAMRPGNVMVKRTVYAGNWLWGNAATSDFWRYVTIDMGSFNNFAEFANVFDEYRVNAIKVTYRPQYDSVTNLTAAGAIVQPQAYAHYIVDPASTLLPSGTYSSTALNTFLENDRVKTVTLNKPFSIYYKPKVTDQVSGTGTAGVMRSSPWIRTSETTTAYRGYHMFLQQNAFQTGNQNVRLDTFITMYCQFRNIK